MMSVLFLQVKVLSKIVLFLTISLQETYFLNEIENTKINTMMNFHKIKVFL